MSKPRNIHKIEVAEFVSIGELAELSGTRYSTLKYYTEIGLLPYEQEAEKRNRRYHKVNCLKLLAEIQILKTVQRLTIDEILKALKES